ncbi:ABC transporter permease [Candidatus Aerophobetes bacterium]|nr:ABC transporter permease [Candidatus Aerophobetes bacterium]
MKQTFILAQKSFRGNLRNKIFVTFFIFAMLLVLVSILFEALTFTAKLKIIKDVGMAGVSIFSALIAIFLSGEAIVGEMERKTVYTLLSKPVDRKDFILGSFLGVVLTTGVAILISGGVLLFLIYVKQGFLESGLFLALIFIGLEITVITSIGIMFSSFCSSSLTSSFLCFLVYILGHLNTQLSIMAKMVESKIVKTLISFARWVLPNLEYFNIREKIVQGQLIHPEYTARVVLYTFFYSAICLTIAWIIFKRREL